MEVQIESLFESAAHRLKGGTEETRFAAVKDLTQVNAIGAIPFLLEAVGDSSFRIREEALKGICAFPPELVFPRLEALVRNHENANLRTAALEAFPRYSSQATAYLLRLLQDGDEEVRLFSAVMLGEVRDPRSVEGLVEALLDSEENVRHAAAESLGKIGDARAVKPLLACLEQDFWIQFPAVVALGNIGDPSATIPMLKLLEDEMLRQAVIEALGKVGDLSVIPVLAGLLAQKDTSIRNDTIAALVKIQSRVERHIIPGAACLPSIKRALERNELVDHLLISLQDRELEVKKNAIIALGWLKQARAVPQLVELLQDYDLEAYAVGALISIGEAGLPDLIRGLENPDPQIRAPLIRCLGWIESGEGIRACLPFLRDQDFEVRYHAVLAMAGAVHSDSIVEALLALLAEPDPEIRSALIEVLGKSRSPVLVEKLLRELTGAVTPRTLTAVQVLGKLKAREAFEPLRALLQESGDEIRAAVHEAVHQIYPSRLSTEILLAGLTDPSPLVRKTSAGCLREGRGEDVERSLIPLLKDSDPEVRLVAMETLGQIGGGACVKSIIGVFQEENKPMKMAIIQALSHLQDKACAELMAELLKEADPDLKRAAAEALGEIRDKRSVPHLIVALEDSDWSVRNAAVRALAKIGDHRCISHLLEKLNDPEDLIKKETVVALGQLQARDAVNAILPLVHNENLQLEVLGALEKLGISDLEFFSEFFSRSNTRLKCQLVDLLGRLRNRSTLDYLLRILDDEFFTVRCRAVKALGELGDRKAIPTLGKALKEDPSEEVRREAGRALKRLASQR